MQSKDQRINDGRRTVDWSKGTGGICGAPTGTNSWAHATNVRGNGCCLSPVWSAGKLALHAAGPECCLGGMGKMAACPGGTAGGCVAAHVSSRLPRQLGSTGLPILLLLAAAAGRRGRCRCRRSGVGLRRRPPAGCQGCCLLGRPGRVKVALQAQPALIVVPIWTGTGAAAKEGRNVTGAHAGARATAAQPGDAMPRPGPAARCKQPETEARPHQCWARPRRAA